MKMGQAAGVKQYQENTLECLNLCVMGWCKEVKNKTWLKKLRKCLTRTITKLALSGMLK